MDGNSAVSSVINKNKEWEIQYAEIQTQEELGKGSFGVVYRGKWRNQSVAVKKVQKMTALQLEDFNAECEVMSRLRPHKNVVQLLGICKSPLCIVTEFYKNGSLLNYLAHQTLTDAEVVKILKGIAAGMVHLHKENVIHRDLAARNILLSELLEPAVADFGFARVLAKEEDVGKTMTTIGPLKWMSPESLQNQQYSTKSDVWSYGVTAWETITRGEIPYGELDSVAASIQVSNGKRLKLPNNCPKKLTSLIVSCWNTNPDDRPTMQEMFENLESFEKENLNLASPSSVIYQQSQQHYVAK